MYPCRSGTNEAFAQKQQLLTELSAMFHEKDVVPTPQQAVKTDRNLALQLREDACAKLAQKVQVTAKEPEAKRPCGSTAEVIVKYLEEKHDKNQQT